ncbi:MAG: hypothetical protein ACTSRG_05625 [Candidatus Helarchaeota archaeon]
MEVKNVSHSSPTKYMLPILENMITQNKLTRHDAIHLDDRCFSLKPQEYI